MIGDLLPNGAGVVPDWDKIMGAYVRRRAQEERADCERRGIRLNKYIPHLPTEKQRQALEIKGKELFFGGAAGGGKSDYLLAAALEYADQEGYAALILRRTLQDLSLPGALIPRSHEWLDRTDAHWNGNNKTWTFPSGARLAFGYLEQEDDKHRYQSSEFQFIGFDEVAQFSETQYDYLFSRLRRKRASEIPVRQRSASNPEGEGYEWVEQRFIPDEYIKSDDDARHDRVWQKNNAFFVPSMLEDNPFLDEQEYDESLLRAARGDPVLYARLRKGQWGLIEAGTLILGEWFPRARYFDKLPDDVVWQARAYDLAVGRREVVVDEKKKKRLPDFHATAVGANDLKRGLLWLGKPEMWREDITQATAKIVAWMYNERALRHGVGSAAFEATVVSGLRADGFAIENVAEPGDKVSRSSFWRDMARQGRVHLVGTVEEWKPFIHYWTVWKGKDTDVDDCIDVVSDLTQMFGMSFTEDHSPQQKRSHLPKLAARLRGRRI